MIKQGLIEEGSFCVLCTIYHTCNILANCFLLVSVVWVSQYFWPLLFDCARITCQLSPVAEFDDTAGQVGGATTGGEPHPKFHPWLSSWAFIPTSSSPSHRPASVWPTNHKLKCKATKSLERGGAKYWYDYRTTRSKTTEFYGEGKGIKTRWSQNQWR